LDPQAPLVLLHARVRVVRQPLLLEPLAHGEFLRLATLAFFFLPYPPLRFLARPTLRLGGGLARGVLLPYAVLFDFAQLAQRKEDGVFTTIGHSPQLPIVKDASPTIVRLLA